MYASNHPLPILSAFASEILFGRSRVREWIRRAIQNGGIHLLDYNCLLFPDDELESVLEKHSFIHIATIARTSTMALAKIFHHFESGTAILLHRPFGVGADSRMPFKRIRICILRLILVEILRKVVHQTSGVTPDDLPLTVQDACVITGYFSEACGFGIHIDRKVEQAIKRDVITSPNIRACEFNNLSRGSSDPLAPVGQRAKQRIRRNDQAGLDHDVQFLDRFIVSVEAVNMMSMLQAADDSTSKSMEDVFELLRRDGKDEYARRNALESCFFDGSKTQKAIKDHRVAVGNNSGNPNARGHTAAELRQCSIDLAVVVKMDLGTPFWVPCSNAAKKVTPSSIGLESELRIDTMVFESIRSAIKDPAHQAKATRGVIRVHKYPGKDANPGEVAEYRGLGDDASSTKGRKKCWVKCILVEEDGPKPPKKKKTEK